MGKDRYPSPAPPTPSRDNILMVTKKVYNESPLLYTKIQSQNFLGSGEEDFCMFNHKRT